MARSDRVEFPVKVKEAAWERSGGRCEAEGPDYGWEPGHRCNADLLAPGIRAEYDHVFGAQTGRAGLSDCVCCCQHCHRYKTKHTDVPREAKIARISKKRRNIKPMRRWASRW